MAELWDAYDRNFNKIGKLLVRGEPVPEGEYHLVAEVIVKHTDESYLIMQRDFKKTFGGLWELSAGGSAIAGEEPLDCALRELKEETGITAISITEIGRTVHEKYRTLFVEYLAVTDCEKTSIVLQRGETVAYRWVSLPELCEIKKEDIASYRSFDLVKEGRISE